MNFTITKVEADKDTRDWILVLIPEDIAVEEDSRFLGAFNDAGELCGMLCYQISHYIAEIRFVAVFPRFRYGGCARQLISSFLEKAEKSFPGMPVSITWEGCNEKNIGRIIRSISGFFVNENPSYYRVEPQSRKDSGEYQRLLSMNLPKTGIIPYEGLSPRMKNELMTQLARVEDEVFIDLSYAYLPDLSICVMEEDKIKAAAFFTEPEEKVINLSFLWMEKGHQKAFATLMGEVSNVFETRYGDYDLDFSVVNEASERLAKRLFPDAVPQYIYSGVKLL